MENTIVALAADHGGYLLKEAIKAHLDAAGIRFIDCGPDSEESCHYPVFARKACNAVQDGRCTCAVLVCGTGIGMSLAANKCRGIRAACCSDTYSARMTRAHNNANALCLGARVVGEGLALDIVDLFLSTPFEGGGRHSTRIGMIDELEKEGR